MACAMRARAAASAAVVASGSGASGPVGARRGARRSLASLAPTTPASFARHLRVGRVPSTETPPPAPLGGVLLARRRRASALAAAKIRASDAASSEEDAADDADARRNRFSNVVPTTTTTTTTTRASEDEDANDADAAPTPTPYAPQPPNYAGADACVPEDESLPPGHVALVDGMSLVFRAFYGWRNREPLLATNGEDLSVMYSVTHAILAILELAPSHVAVCFDAKGKTFRHEMFTDYKGAFYTLVPIRPRCRGERRSLRTFAVLSLRPPLAFNPRPRRL
jgi:hypothetical protein